MPVRNDASGRLAASARCPCGDRNTLVGAPPSAVPDVHTRVPTAQSLDQAITARSTALMRAARRVAPIQPNLSATAASRTRVQLLQHRIGDGQHTGTCLVATLDDDHLRELLREVYIGEFKPAARDAPEI